MSVARDPITASPGKGPAQVPEEGDGGVFHAPLDPRDVRVRGAHERTCVGCGDHAEPADLVRLVIGPEGEIAVDAAGGGFGRGAHVHARAACLAQAAGRGLARATKGRAASVSVAVKEGAGVSTSPAVPLDAGALARAIEAAMARRIAGLVATAARTRKARIGSDAATAAWRAGDAALIIVATDAAAAADLSAVREAIAAGAAVAWGTKQGLAAALGRNDAPEGVAVVAITDTRIAGAARDAVEKTLGVHASGSAAGPRPPAAKRPRINERKAPARRLEDAAPKAGFRSKVEPKRAGRASGRQQRRAQENRQ